MLNKRDYQKNVSRCYCPKCDRRLWHTNTPKYFLCTTEALAAKYMDVDCNSWIEEFMCGEHGKLWMKIHKKPDGSLCILPATSKDWQQTNCTIQPELSLSVGKYINCINCQVSARLIRSKD